MADSAARLALRVIGQAPSGNGERSIARRKLKAAGMGGLLLVLLLPAFVFLAPSPHWQPVELVLSLGALAIICFASSAVIRRETSILDPGMVVALPALVFLGPLPAALILVSVEPVMWLLERYSRVALLANAASFGLAAIAAGLVIATFNGAAPSSTANLGSYLVIAAAWFVFVAITYFVQQALLAVVRDGLPFRVVVREWLNNMPVEMLMMLLGLATVYLYTQIGILALGIFAAIVLIPQLLLPVLLRPRPVDELSHSEAVALYAQAIASVLKLDSTNKSILADAAHHIEGPDTQTNGNKIKAEYSGDNFHDVVEAVLYYREHWDSPDGFPGGVGGEMIPLTSRILAVADQWASLTASGVWTVTHAQAINKLEENSGVQYDPRVVAAASRVVEEERMGLTDNQPQLHEVPLPELVRKVPRLSGLIAGARSGA